MNRKLISREALENKLNATLHEILGNKKIYLKGIIPLAKEDDDGVNWSRAITAQGSEIDVKVHAQDIALAIEIISKEYNIDG